MDLTGDGNGDLVVFDHYGKVYLYERNSDGTLKAGVRITVNGSNIGGATGHGGFIVDWNEDGLLDLLYGPNQGGGKSIRLYINSGTTSQYVFTDYTDLSAGGGALSISEPVVQVIDLNYDGKKDLVLGMQQAGSEGRTSQIFFYENIGTNAKPELADGVMLTDKSGNGLCASSQYYRASMMHIVDWNNDNGLDVLWTKDLVTGVHLCLGDPRPTEIGAGSKKGLIGSMPVGKYVGGNFVVALNLTSPQSIEFKVINVNGRALQMINKIVAESGKQTAGFAMNNYTPGVYFVNYKINGMNIVNKIVVKK